MRGVSGIAFLLAILFWFSTGDESIFVFTYLLSLFIGGFLFLIVRPFL